MNVWKIVVATLAIFIAGALTGAVLVGYGDRISQKNRRQLLQREANRPPQNTNRPAAFPNPNVGGSGPRDPQARQANPPPRVPRAMSGEFLQKLDSEVHLTSGQRERIDAIIAEGQSRNKEIWDRVAPEIRRENMETQRRVRDVLTAEQLARFDELMKQSRPNQRRPDETLPADKRPREQRRSPAPRDDAERSSPRENP